MIKFKTDGSVKAPSSIFISVNGEKKEVRSVYAGSGGESRKIWGRDKGTIMFMAANGSKDRYISYDSGNSWELKSIQYSFDAFVPSQNPMNALYIDKEQGIFYYDYPFAHSNDGLLVDHYMNTGQNDLSPGSRLQANVRQVFRITDNTYIFGSNYLYKITIPDSEPHFEYIARNMDKWMLLNNDSLPYKSGSGAGIFYNSCAYVNGRLFLGSPSGLHYSDDFTGFTKVPDITTYDGLMYKNGIYIAIANISGSSSRKIAVSGDGINWMYGPSGMLVKLKYLNGKFFVVCYNGILFSGDGTDWSECSGFLAKDTNLYDIDYCPQNKKYYACAYPYLNNTRATYLYSSTDGVEFKRDVPPPASSTVLQISKVICF